MSRDLILQINVPLCVRRCAHCRQRNEKYSPELAAAYAEALLAEIEAAAPDFSDYAVRAVAFEGGSPALLAAGDLQRILRALRRSFSLSQNAQISIQTMPGDYSRALMEKLRDNGVGFWIVGLDTAELKEHELLGRPYRFDALTMVDTALRTFDPRALSFELLYGIPGQTPASWAHTLETALAYRPDHLTLRPLALAPGSALRLDCDMGLVNPLGENAVAALRAQAAEALTSLGYRPYTRVDWCLPGGEHRFRQHQLQGTEQLGLGYGAASLLDGYSYTNGHSLAEYLAHPAEPEILANNVVLLEGEALAAYERARQEMRS